MDMCPSGSAWTGGQAAGVVCASLNATRGCVIMQAYKEGFGALDQG